MEKLYEIMGDLTEIEYGMESLSCVLKSLEEIYEYNQKYEIHKNAWILKMLLDSMAENLSNKIIEIDSFILCNKNI